MLDGCDGLPIHTGSASVRLHLLPRSAQDVLAVHFVVERMEPPRGIRLRGPVQCSLEFSHSVRGVGSLSGNHQRLPPANTQTKYGPFPPLGLCCPEPRRYYGPLRLPLRTRPFRGNAAYRAHRSPSPQRVAPTAAHCWG